MRVLVLGGSGLLGGHLSFSLRGNSWISTSLSRREPAGFDHWIKFSQLEDLLWALGSRRYDLVVNTIAVTSLAFCEQNPGYARQVNGLWPEIWARYCNDHEVPFVHISTDAVFSGNDRSLRSETSPTRPINQYGRSKLEGEERVLAATSDGLVVRTNFFGWSRGGNKGILDFFYQNLNLGRKVPGFADYVTSGIYATDFAEQLWELIRLRQTGLFHLASASPMSKLEFGRAVATEFGFSSENVFLSSRDSLGVQRSSFLGLDSRKAARVLAKPSPGTVSGLGRARRERRLVTQHLAAAVGSPRAT